MSTAESSAAGAAPAEAQTQTQEVGLLDQIIAEGRMGRDP